MVITFLAKKGGVGKSTLSVLLYESLRRGMKGKTVAIRDWDSQGTSNTALDMIDGQKADAGESYDVLIYDTPPSLTHTATAAAVQNADITLVITSPSPADIWEADQAVQFAQSQNKDAVVRLVFNKVRGKTVLGRLVPRSAEGISAPMLDTMLSYRECYQHAIGKGWSALDRKAREEVLELTVAILGLK